MPPRFHALAFDYDGTLTHRDALGAKVRDGLARARADGYKLVLVTGRILAELREVLPDVEDLFDAIVAENGAVLANADGVRLLAPPVDPELARALAARDVPLRSGRVLLACDARHAPTVLEEVGRLGLDEQLVRNRGALMVLSSGVSKGTGLLDALGDLRVSARSTVAVGDAENDLPLLEAAELGVAVADGVDSLKQRADLVLERPDGEGVLELLDGPVLSGRERVVPQRRRLALGATREGNPVTLPAAESRLLVAGPSGSGKSYLTGLLVEQLVALRYGVLVLDREGDHVGLASRRGVVLAGGASGPPPPSEVVTLLCHRFGSVVLDLSLLDDAQRVGYERELLPLVCDLEQRCGSPHWIVLDEAHVTFEDSPAACAIAGGGGRVFTTYRPDELSDAVRAGLDAAVLLAGDGPGAEDVGEVIASLCGDLPEALPEVARLEQGQGLLLPLAGQGEPVVFELGHRCSPHVRHWHKYTEAQLPDGLRFRFGADGERGVAGNIREFHRLLRTLDEGALREHAARSDFSRWIRDALQERDLATSVAIVEADLRVRGDDAERVRAELLATIERHYLAGLPQLVSP